MMPLSPRSCQSSSQGDCGAPEPRPRGESWRSSPAQRRAFWPTSRHRRTLFGTIGVGVLVKDACSNVVWDVEGPEESGALWHLARNYVLSFARCWS